MGNEDTGQQDVKTYESGQIAEKPDVSDEQKQHAEEMRKSYEEEPPRPCCPGLTTQ